MSDKMLQISFEVVSFMKIFPSFYAFFPLLVAIYFIKCLDNCDGMKWKVILYNFKLKLIDICRMFR